MFHTARSATGQPRPTSMMSFHFAALAIASSAGNHMYAWESPKSTMVRVPLVSPNKHVGILGIPMMQGFTVGYLVDGWSLLAADTDGVTLAGSVVMEGAAATSAATCWAVPGAVLASAAGDASV